MRVLIVEDEERLASTLSIGLQAEGFLVVHVANGVDGLRQAAENRFDVVVLDIMLPGLNGYEVLRRLRERNVWTPARMTRQRLWQTVGFLALVAIVFMVTTIRDEVQALRDDRAEQHDPARLLAGTPLEIDAGHQPMRTPLSLAEQVNVVAVMVVSQAIQVVFFTIGLFAFFLALGIIAVPDDVTVLWSAEANCAVGQPPCAATWFGVHIPIPQTVVHTSLFVAVLSGLYFTVSTSVDPLYRQRFFDPLVSDVATSLAGRDAYLDMERASHP